MIDVNPHNLNDLMYFSQVVEHGGFSAAERALGISKSRLSRRLAELEATLGVRLLHRSTRKLALTEAGEAVYQHCRAMLREATAAVDAVSHLHASPRGTIRVSCPATFSQSMVSRLLPDFMQRYPDIKVIFRVTNRVVDLFEDGLDVALRVRSAAPPSANLVVRPLWRTEQMLLAAPALLARHGTPALFSDLRRFRTLDTPSADGRHVFHLIPPDGVPREFEHEPCLVTADLVTLREAALAGIGIAALPEMVYRSAVQDGRLVPALPGWRLPQPQLYAVFLTRRGLSPAVRAFVDFLVERLPGEAGTEA